MTSPVGAARPQPLTKASGAVSVIATLVTLAVTFGVLPAADGDAVVNAVNVTVVAVVAIVGVLHTLTVHFTAQRRTTPVDDPHAEVVQPDGTTKLEPLVAVSLATDHLPASPDPYMDTAGQQSAPDGFSTTV
jgi:hypothetical protein